MKLKGAFRLMIVGAFATALVACAPEKRGGGADGNKDDQGDKKGPKIPIVIPQPSYKLNAEDWKVIRECTSKYRRQMSDRTWVAIGGGYLMSCWTKRLVLSDRDLSSGFEDYFVTKFKEIK